MEQWWTVVRIASKAQEPVVIVRPGRMTKKGIHQLIKREVQTRKIKEFLTGAFRHVLASEKPKY
jgi:hypothetical protein